MESFWEMVRGPHILQGDYLLNCMVATHPPEMPLDAQVEAVVRTYDLIVVTQSCDLENDKVSFVATCKICTLTEFCSVVPDLKTKGRREELRKGRLEGLHLLACPDTPADNERALVVDFREIYSLPVEYAKRHAEGLVDRWRLRSPYLEHFSQAFARFFMRVGLPSTIPRYT